MRLPAALFVLGLSACDKTSYDFQEPPSDLAMPVLPDLGEGFVDVTPDPPPFVVPGPVDDPHAVPVPQMAGALLADLDGDGRDEVVMAPAWHGSPAPSVYHYGVSGRKIGLSPVLFVLPPDVSVRAAADMDGDGIVDVVLDGPGICWGEGGGMFSAPDWFSNQGTRESALALADMDGDGWLDILQVVNLGSDPHDIVVFLHVAGRAFRKDASVIEEPGAGIVDSLGVMLLDDVPTLALAVAQQVPGQELLPRFYRKSGSAWRPAALFPKDGLSWENFMYGSPMGAAACDLDGDGMIDFAAAMNPDTLFWAGGKGGAWQDCTHKVGPAARLPIAHGHVYPPMGWAFGCFDIDGDGTADLVEAYGNDATGFVAPSNDAGPQPIKAWRFGAGWRSTDMTPAAGLGRMGQWHSLSVGDIDGDGAPDFAVGGWGEVPRVYLNRTGTPTAAVRIRSRHGQPVYGVRVEAAGRRWDASAISPLVHSDAIAFVTGAGGDVVARFPDGTSRTILVEPGRGFTAAQP